MKLHSYLFIVAIGFSSLASANVIARQQADVSSPATSFAPSTTTSTAISTDTSQDETQPSQTPSVNSTSLASSTAVSSTNTKISLVPSDGAAASPPIGSNKSNATNIYRMLLRLRSCNTANRVQCRAWYTSDHSHVDPGARSSWRSADSYRPSIRSDRDYKSSVRIRTIRNI